MHTELEKNRTKDYLSSAIRKTQTNEHIIDSLSSVSPNMTCSEEKLAKNITMAKNDVESNNEPKKYNSLIINPSIPEYTEVLDIKNVNLHNDIFLDHYIHDHYSKSTNDTQAIAFIQVNSCSKGSLSFPFAIGSIIIDSEQKFNDLLNSMAVYGSILSLNVINTMVNAPQSKSTISNNIGRSITRCNIHYFFCIYNYEFGLCEFCFKILLFMIFFDVDENTNFIKLKKACFVHATNCINLLSNMFYMFYNVETASFAAYIHEFTTREQTSAINAIKLTRKCYYENVNDNCNTIAIIDEKIKNISNDNNIVLSPYFKKKNKITKEENYTELNKTIFDITEIMYLEEKTHGLLEQ
ncbi:hypothetical protein COBT_003428, partial [Conglomerata obtusa]